MSAGTFPSTCVTEFTPPPNLSTFRSPRRRAAGGLQRRLLRAEDRAARLRCGHRRGHGSGRQRRNAGGRERQRWQQRRGHRWRRVAGLRQHCRAHGRNYCRLRRGRRRMRRPRGRRLLCVAPLQVSGRRCEPWRGCSRSGAGGRCSGRRRASFRPLGTRWPRRCYRRGQRRSAWGPGSSRRRLQHGHVSTRLRARQPPPQARSHGGGAKAGRGQRDAAAQRPHRSRWQRRCGDAGSGRRAPRCSTCGGCSHWARSWRRCGQRWCGCSDAEPGRGRQPPGAHPHDGRCNNDLAAPAAT